MVKERLVAKTKKDLKEKQEESKITHNIIAVLCIIMVKTLKKRTRNKKKHRKRTLKKISNFQQYEKVGSRIITRKAFLNYSLARFKKLSPFELKNTLIYLAKTRNPLDDFTMFLNAGRGNPNFFNSFVRECYTQLQASCLQLSSDLQPIPDVKKIVALKVYPLPTKMNFQRGMMKHLKGMSRSSLESP